MPTKHGLNGLSDAEVHKILELGESGATLAEISRSTQVSTALVNSILSGAGVKPMLVRRRLREQRLADIAEARKQQKESVSPRDLEVLAMSTAGATYEEIGIAFGISRERARQIIKRHEGVKPKDVRRARRRDDEENERTGRERLDNWLREHPGATLEELGSAMDMSTESAEKLVTHRNRHLILAIDDRSRFPDAPRRWTRTDILEAIRVAATFETPLSRARYDELRVQHSIDGPSGVRILQVFRTWSQACTESGVQHGRRIRSQYVRRWTTEEMLDHVATFLLQSSTGSLEAYNAWARDNDAPGGQTVRNQFENWRETRSRALIRLRALWADLGQES